MIDTADEIFVKQKKEWTEIVINFETKNQYSVLDPGGGECGTISEISSGVGGFLRRTFFGSHRALDVRVNDGDGTGLLRFARPFFFPLFFSGCSGGERRETGSGRTPIRSALQKI
jgi:hypothetical protein